MPGNGRRARRQGDAGIPLGEPAPDQRNDAARGRHRQAVGDRSLRRDLRRATPGTSPRASAPQAPGRSRLRPRSPPGDLRHLERRQGLRRLARPQDRGGPTACSARPSGSTRRAAARASSAPISRSGSGRSPRKSRSTTLRYSYQGSPKSAAPLKTGRSTAARRTRSGFTTYSATCGNGRRTAGARRRPPRRRTARRRLPAIARRARRAGALGRTGPRICARRRDRGKPSTRGRKKSGFAWPGRSAP